MSSLGDNNLMSDAPKPSTQDLIAEGGNFSCKFSMTANCDPKIVGTCIICKEPFCALHQSEADSESCITCTDYKTLELKKEPLIDDDGVKHEGAKITPIGLTYRTLISRISEMADYQLEAHISHVRQQVKEAETVLDYRRIDLAASQVELEERHIAKRKNLRMKSVSMLANGSKVISAPDSPGKVAKDKALYDVGKKLMGLAKLLGLPCTTSEDIAKLAMRLQEMNKKPAIEVK